MLSTTPLLTSSSNSNPTSLCHRNVPVRIEPDRDRSLPPMTTKLENDAIPVQNTVKYIGISAAAVVIGVPVVAVGVVVAAAAAVVILLEQ